MKAKFMTKSEIESYVNKMHNEKSLIISIRDPLDYSLSLNTDVDNGVQFILSFTYNQITTYGNNCRMISEQDANKIAKAILYTTSVDTIIVYSDSGESSSRAIVAAIMNYYNDENTVNIYDPKNNISTQCYLYTINALRRYIGGEG